VARPAPWVALALALAAPQCGASAILGRSGGTAGAPIPAASRSSEDARSPATSPPRELAERFLHLVRKSPRESLGVAVFSVLLQAHARIQVEKRSALRALKKLGSATRASYDITIVTTAALPWKTGTAVNALLRATALADLGHRVTLCIPWIHPAEQEQVFPGGRTFDSPDEQEAHMREWLSGRQQGSAGSAQRPFAVSWYPARYDIARGSILPLGDLTRWTNPDGGARDLCVLEEPEHLNWYHGGGDNWRRRFKLVVGVVHTNYLQYAKMYQPENVAIVAFINRLVCRAYCDRNVKLSDSLQTLCRASVCNVHGVRSEFIEMGRRAAKAAVEAPPLLGFGRRSFEFSGGAYFIGKLLWAKGHRLLIDYLAANEEGADPSSALPDVAVDVYGDGEDANVIKAAASKAGLAVSFPGSRDHADASLHGYKVFVNPSQTEVLSTTTAEALAMGKFVVIERHPSNEFFYGFSNTRTFTTPAEFRIALAECLASTPAPLSAAESRALSWAGATERFLSSVDEAMAVASAPTLCDEAAHLAHCAIAGPQGTYLADAIRKYIFESGPVARQRWLHREQRYRASADVMEVVEKSVEVSPPEGHDLFRERYHSGEGHKSWTAKFQKKKKA